MLVQLPLPRRQPNDAAACCQAATPDPPPPPALATCGDKDGDGTGTDAVSGSDCGAGWATKANSAALECVGAACDMNLEDDKLQCCTKCVLGEFALADDATCTAHADCAAGEGYSGDTADAALQANIAAAGYGK